jgi:hypothetical protein
VITFTIKGEKARFSCDFRVVIPSSKPSNSLPSLKNNILVKWKERKHTELELRIYPYGCDIDKNHSTEFHKLTTQQILIELELPKRKNYQL